jgi:small subunit ribosomal protein S2
LPSWIRIATRISLVIPGNDDALRAIRLFTSKIAEAVLTGRQSFEESQIAEQKSAEGELEGGPEYVDTSAYEQYEQQEGDFVEGEPTEVLPDDQSQGAAAAAGEDENAQR